MGCFNGLEISASGLNVEKYRMDIVATNIANANNTSSDPRLAYREKFVVSAPNNQAFGSYLAGFRRGYAQGVSVEGVYENPNPPRLVYEPNHPHADSQGYVAYPDINIIDQMVDAMEASRSYEANMTAFNETKRILSKALEIGKA